jgi:hypothetical protein
MVEMMLVQVNPIKEAELILSTENAIINNFFFDYEEVQSMPTIVVNYLLTTLVKRKQKQDFQRMVMKNS